MACSNSESFTIQDTRKEVFEKALHLLFDSSFLGRKNLTVTGYLVMNNTLYLTGYNEASIPGNAIKLPFGFSRELAIQFAWEWFQNNQTPIDPEPDGDGSTSMGFHITTEGLTSIGLHAYFCSINPVWFYYGK